MKQQVKTHIILAFIQCISVLILCLFISYKTNIDFEQNLKIQTNKKNIDRFYKRLRILD